MSNFYFCTEKRKICLTEFLQAGTWARTECHGGRPIFVTQQMSSCMGLISVGIGLESGGVDDSLVVHQLVTLVVWEGEELVGLGVSDDLVGFDDLGLARVVLRVLDFVEHVLAHDVIVELGFALAVETEPSHLAFDFAVLGLVAVILGTSRDEFGDVVVRVQFAGELPEVVSQRRVGLSGFLEIDD